MACIFVNGVFWRVDIFNFDEVQHITVVSFIISVFCDVNKFCSPQGHKQFPCFLLEILSFIFRSIMIHCELIFVYGESKGQSSFSPYGYSGVQALFCWKAYYFPTELSICFCQKSVDHYYVWVYFWILYIFIVMPILHCLAWCKLH